jgi:hypothetical protein
MLCAPIPHSFHGYGLVRTNDAIDGMTLDQLRTGILQGCVSGGVAAPHVALINFIMDHPFGHCRSWAAHEADALFHGTPKTLGSATRYPRFRHWGWGGGM